MAVGVLVLSVLIFVALLILLLVIFWIWAFIDCLNSRLSAAQKLFWVILILFFNLMGVLLYFIFSRTVGEKMAKGKNFKGKKLMRSEKNKVIAGVCGGIGEYFGVDPTAIRLLWVIVTVFTGFVMGILAYIVAWIIVPEH